MSANIETQLLSHLSEEQLIAIAEAFGGTRLYIPLRADDDHPIVQTVGRAAFEKLSSTFSPDVIRVPLCRRMRINHYQAGGLSKAKIATRLGVTEPAVDKVLRDLREKGEILPKSHAPLPNARNVRSNNTGGHCPCCQHYNPDRETSLAVEA